MSDFNDDGSNDPFDPRFYHKDGRPKRQATGDYENGYARTPVATRFQPGKSGNPKGRPKRARGFKAEFGEVINEKVTLTSKDDGRKLEVTRLRASLRALASKAANGNVAAIKELIALNLNMFGDGSEPEGPRKLSANDQALLDGYLAGSTVGAASPTGDESPTSEPEPSSGGRGDGGTMAPSDAAADDEEPDNG